LFRCSSWFSVPACALALLSAAGAGPKRLVIADQDAMGPAGSDTRAWMVLLQDPNVELLGITTVTGDGWMKEETAHALRTLELLGRTDIRVYMGANQPLWRTQAWTEMAQKLYGRAHWMGAWRKRPGEFGPDKFPAPPHGNPATQAADEHAAQFMVRMVRKYPGRVTIYGAGPLTNIALAISLDPEFASLAQELVVMGGSLRPDTDLPEWTNAPRHEFNFWFDPESASITLRAPWKKVSVTTIDASLRTRVSPEVTDGVFPSDAPAAKYLKKYTRMRLQGIGQIAWDDLAAATWLDPTITTKKKVVYMDVNTDRGPGYGDTLTWSEELKPDLPLRQVHAQMEIDLAKFQKLLIRLFASPTPGATAPPILTEEN
jgi:inosine-uridine nucleoside N-ribohydrolase